jgi:hypothetical protein
MARKQWKSAKGQTWFRCHHSTVDHIFTLMIIVEEFRDDKTNPLCCFF